MASSDDGSSSVSPCTDGYSAKLAVQHEKSLPKPKVAGSTPAGTASVFGISDELHGDGRERRARTVRKARPSCGKLNIPPRLER